MCGIAVAIDWDGADKAVRHLIAGILHRGDITDPVVLVSDRIAMCTRRLRIVDVANAVRVWGSAGIKRLAGMYAFVDTGTGEFLAARDPFGVKPLYLIRSREGFCFARKSDRCWRRPKRVRFSCCPRGLCSRAIIADAITYCRRRQF
jgi:asparagine synthase (glutamine-hydrolysing)